jgi:hypothetical protein
MAICLTVVIAHAEAHAGECTLETPACHLQNGKRLLEKEPKRAADELLASYRLDERTDTLALYATALERDRRYGHALETWQRIIVFRESELDAAKAAVRKARSSKRAAARAAVARAEEQMQEAAEAIMRLWSSVARVRVRIPAGQQLAVAHDGEEVDVSREVLVNAGRDELVFTRKDGSVERVTVEVAAGANATIDAPVARMAKAAPQKPMKLERPKAAEVEAPAKPAQQAKAEPPIKPAKPAAAAESAEPPFTAVRLTEEPRSRAMSRVGLGLVAGAVVAAGAAGGLGYLASHDYDRSRQLGCSSDGQCPFGPAADLAERSNDRARLAQISAVAGGAMLATGAVLWLVGRGKTRRAPAPADVALRVTPSFTATSAATSAALSWRF